jgi:RNA polymerase sigma-70 factor (ECF subfamily)
MMAFDNIYLLYSKRLYRFVYRFLKRETDTEEIVQEVFIKIWEARSKIDVYTSFESFIFTIAYNTTISLLRKRVTEKKYLDYLMSVQITENEPDLVEQINFNDLNESFHQLLNKLTPRQKEIFLLSREQGLSHAEIAKKLNISENTVKNHIVSALSFLKTNLDSSMLSGLLFVYLFL